MGRQVAQLSTAPTPHIFKHFLCWLMAEPVTVGTDVTIPCILYSVHCTVYRIVCLVYVPDILYTMLTLHNTHYTIHNTQYICRIKQATWCCFRCTRDRLSWDAGPKMLQFFKTEHWQKSYLAWKHSSHC